MFSATDQSSKSRMEVTAAIHTAVSAIPSKMRARGKIFAADIVDTLYTLESSAFILLT
jgi:hypothetical protein